MKIQRKNLENGVVEPGGRRVRILGLIARALLILGATLTVERCEHDAYFAVERDLFERRLDVGFHTRIHIH